MGIEWTLQAGDTVEGAGNAAMPIRCWMRWEIRRVGPVPKIVFNHAEGARACPELAEGVPRFWGRGRW